ncbi:MAG: hypothetical protein KIT22_00375 [Verrucomicrobiae bacterium]|nr:hypothetical protein [Verrucomicrobiae bacterium]
MRSHEYRFSLRELGAVLGAPLGGLGCIALLLHGLNAAGWLPPSRPLRDLDHTVLWHQIQASRRPARSPVVLVGDSSCLTGVSARQLGETLSRPVKNLGMVSTLGLDAFGTLAADAVAAANRDSGPAEVVLLVHPEFLRRPAADPGMSALFEALRQGRMPPAFGSAAWGGMQRAIGADLFRDRIESWLRPGPLRGVFGARYGFDREALAAMDSDGGGLVDPGRFLPNASTPLPPLEISLRLEAAAARFVPRLPAGTRVRIGVMPVPESLAGPEAAVRSATVAETLARWLGPDVHALKDLPAALPNADFASGTHLNADGRERFTRRLAEFLR